MSKIILSITGDVPIEAERDELVLGVSADGLKFREPLEFRVGDYVANPQRLGMGTYQLAAIHRIEAEGGV